jgi:hypothetical protein
MISVPCYCDAMRLSEKTLPHVISWLSRHVFVGSLPDGIQILKARPREGRANKSLVCARVQFIPFESWITFTPPKHVTCYSDEDFNKTFQITMREV